MMTSTRKAILMCCLLLSSTPALAGMEKEGYSRREGLFFTFLEGGHIGFETIEHAMNLHRHCESGNFVFRFKDQKKFKCHVTLRKREITNEPESYGSIEILDGSKDPNHDWKYDLYSTMPTRNTKWQVRPLSQEQVTALTAFISSDDKRYGHLPRQLAFGKAVSVSKASAVQMTIIVPGKWVRSEDYEAQRHHIFVGSLGNYRYQGQIPDKPTHYFDVDGDSFPEIETSASCDGWCISLWDISAGPKEIARFGGH